MEEQPLSVRIYPGELRPVYYTSVLAFRSTQTVELIRLSLERLQIFEDKTLYELFEGVQGEKKDTWTKLTEEDTPVIRQENWKSGEKEMRFFLRRKEHASLVLTEIVSQYISPEVDDGQIEDMCNLEELSEQAMLSNLRGRFSHKEIYTYVGSILISVNPYYYYSIYNPKYATQYVGKPFSALPPHIFATADNAYHCMLNERQNQSVIISGESGAGKTESTKFLLHHLMSLSAKLDESQSLELITLGTGPVLEAFGNAMTVANNNSSRFGKFIEVNFKENGAYQGASIEKYLLEKSRIISQAPGERNYHVFYYLLLGTDPELQKQLNLLDLDKYQYLTQGSSVVLPNSSEEYHRLRQSLTMLSFSADTQMSMFTVLSAILHIGNIAFAKKEGEEAAKIENTDCLKTVSELLQVEERTLWLALTTRTSKAGGTDCIVLPYRVEEAIATRDSLAKALYGALFDWIVDQVNISLSCGGKRHKGYSIGVLDIFGFEVFQKNSFEQFCINFANEQLQQYFNKHIFKLEQEEYESEGIEWSSVVFVDNQDCLDLVAKKPTGLLPLLDEECSFPGADDHSLFQKFERQHKNHSHYRSPQMKLKDPQFTILHYASEVTYSIKDFRAKNRDLMRQDIVDVLKTSHMDLVRALIDLPPYAVHLWHSAYLKVIAMFTFRKAGRDHREKLDNRFSSSLPFKFRTGSSPALSHKDQRTSSGRSRAGDLATSISVPGEGHDSPDAFPLEYGGKLKTGFGIRASRSYDLLTEAVKKEETDGDHLSMSVTGTFLYGSPRLVRKAPQSTAPKAPPTIASKPQPAPAPPTKKSRDPHSRGKSPVEKRERSRLPSISGLQEKLKKRWPRSLRNKETADHKDHRSHKFWRSAPRVRSTENSSDPRLLRSLSSRRGPSKTVGGQFQVSLTSLMERLEKTNPFFIRCIKSNGEKAPCQFDNDLVLRQLRYTGMMETVKIRKAGYSVRTDFEDFYERYQFLMGPRQADLGLQIKLFLTALGFSSEDIQIGKTKVFMRDKQKQALQAELGDKVLARIIKIQRWVRAKMLRCRYLHMRRCAVTIQCAMRCFLAKKIVDKRRDMVCKAVLIQTAWRSFIARKRLVLLKHAAIIMQAYWRGRCSRRKFALLLEEDQRRRQEELERLAAEEERRKEQEKEEALKKEELVRQKKVEALKKAEALKKELEEQERERLEQERVAHREHEENPSIKARLSAVIRDSLILDSEVTDVLFHFDTIMDALEVQVDNPTPSPRPQSPNQEAATMTTGLKPTPDSEPPSPSDVEFSELSRLCKEHPPTSPVNRKRSLPKVREIQKQLLLTRRDSEPAQLKQRDVSPTRINVLSIIQQLHVKRPSMSPEPPPCQPRPRSNSKSIQNKITELTTSDESEDKGRSYTPPLLRRKIKSPFLERSKSEDFESTLSELAERSHPLAETISPSPSPLPGEEANREMYNSYREASADIGTMPPTEPATTSVELTKSDDLSEAAAAIHDSVFDSSIEENSQTLALATEKSETVGPDMSHDNEPIPMVIDHQEIGGSVRSKSDREETLEETVKQEDSKQAPEPSHSKEPASESKGISDHKRSAIVSPEDVSLTFKPELEEHPESSLDKSTSSSHVELILGVRENGLFEAPPRIVDPTVTADLESSSTSGIEKSSQYDHLLAMGHYDHLPPLGPDETEPERTMFRYRSASDVTSRRVHPVAGPPADSNMTSSTVVPREYSEHHFNSLQRRRAVVSVADPTDIGLEKSSEFTQGLTTEEIARLNQQTNMRSPAERHNRVFSFHKRHLKLPFRSKGKKDKDRDKLTSPDKDSRSSTPTRYRKLSSSSFRSIGSKRNADGLLPHTFKQTTGTRFSIHACEACHKGFTGFMKHALKCVDCEMMVHRHCEDTAPPCKAKIASGSYVTMSRQKVVKKLEDLDDLARFLLDKIAMLSKNTSPGSLIERVFQLSLMEFHTSLITSYSLSLQSSGEFALPGNEDSSAHLKSSITFSQLVSNFSNIFKGIAKREKLSDPCTISIGINQIKTLLDEFGKARRFKRSYSTTINPSELMRKTKSGKDIQAKVHKGHKFFPQQFKVVTVCEFCSRSIGLLQTGEVCEVCGYACHEGCFKKTHKKCEGKNRSKPIPEYNPSPKIESSQFGRPLEDLVPPNTIKVPPLLETCFTFLESNGLYTQGVYRKSAGVSSKKAVRTALEEDPENAKLDNYSIHAVASAVGSFFRELPEPLLTRELYMEFIRAMDITNKKERMETLHQLISRLPPINHVILERVIFHLARFAQHEHINKMTPNNLAIIFAPCLLHGPLDRSPDEILKDLGKQTMCLEAIIQEQLEKLTATIRDIRTLDIYLRSTTSKLSKLIDQFEQPSSESSSRKSSLTSTVSSTKPPSNSVDAAPKEAGSEEKRKQLTETLEELERERVQLTVNLHKLEYFNGSSEDELEQASDSDKWHSSPSPTPLTPPTTITRGARDISPISESTEPRASWTLDVSSDIDERQSRGGSPLSSPITPPGPSSPTTPTIVIRDDDFPTLPNGPALTHLTKNRTRYPTRRPPTAEQRRKLSREQDTQFHPISPLAKESHSSPAIPELDMLDYFSEMLLRETTV